MFQSPKVPAVLRILNVHPPFIPCINPRYSRITRIEYLKTSLTTLDEEVIVVGNGEVEVVVEDEKSRLICAKYLLKFMEHDLEVDDHAP
jgi:hypothetical protein